ncbi:unnamed protein product [Absidia cylindrospora]
MSQPTTPRSDSDSSSPTSQRVERTTTQPSSSSSSTSPTSQHAERTTTQPESSSSSPSPVLPESSSSTSPPLSQRPSHPITVQAPQESSSSTSPPISQPQSYSFVVQGPPASDSNGIVGTVKKDRWKRPRFDANYEAPLFGRTEYRGNVYATDRTTVLDVAIQSQFDRGFFLVGTDWTCYRRNYFQISSTLSLQDVVGLNDGEDIPCYVRDDKDTLHKVQQFYVGIGAEISNFGKQVTLIQHTAKRDKGPLHSPGPIPIHPVGNTSLGTLGADHSLAVFERIQFRTATANNGKGRALQQHFVVVMEILAKTESSDELIPVATTTSQPLVVRGRSPGHYGDSSSAAPIIHEHQPYPHHQHPATFPPTYPHAGVLMMSNGASPSSTTGTYYYPQPQSPTAPLRPTPPVKREPSLAPQQPPPAHPNVYSYSYYSPPHSRPSESPHYTDHQPVKDEHPRRIQDHQYQQQQQYQEHAIPPTSHHRHVIDPSSSGHDNDNAPSPVADSTTFDQTPQQPILIDDNHSISTPPVQRCFDIRESRLRAPPQSDVRTPTTWKQWHPPSQQKGDSASRRKKIRTSNNGAGKKGASSSK